MLVARFMAKSILALEGVVAVPATMQYDKTAL